VKEQDGTMALNEQDYQAVEQFIKSRFPVWLKEFSFYDNESLKERMVRVEEELRHQRELMLQGFAMMEKRFESNDKRFESIDKRFESLEESIEKLSARMFQFMLWSFGFTATAAGIIIAVMKMSL